MLIVFFLEKKIVQFKGSFIYFKREEEKLN